MLLDRDFALFEQDTIPLRSWFTTTFFFEKLLNEKGNRQYQYKNVRRWTKHIDIFSCDKVFIPININNAHWTLLVFYMLLKEVHFYDSNSGNGAKYLKNDSYRSITNNIQ